MVDADLEHIVHQAHAALEVDVEGQDLDGAVELELELGVTGYNVLPVERGVVGRAGVDLQHGAGMQADGGNAQVDRGRGAQGEYHAFAGVQDGGVALEIERAERAQIELHVERCLYALLVDLQRHGAFKRNTHKVDAARALEQQRAGFDVGQLGQSLAVRVAHDLLVRIQPERADLLLAAGGVDLQQHAGRDRERACVQNFCARAAQLQAAVYPAADDTQRAHHIQRLQDRQVQRGHQAQLHALLGHHDEEVALQRERAVQQVQAAVAFELHVHAGPGGLLGRRGRYGVLPVSELRWCGAVVAVVVQSGLEHVGYVVDDLLAEGVHGQIKMRVDMRQAAQAGVHRQLHAQRHTRYAIAFTDHQQAGGFGMEGEVVRAYAGVHIGEYRDAFALAGAEVENAVQVHQAEQVELGLAEDADQLLLVSQHDGLGRIAGVYRIASVVLDHGGRAVVPGGLGEIYGGEGKIHAGRVKGDGAGNRVARITGKNLGPQARIQVELQTFRRQHHISHAHQPDGGHLGLGRQIHAHRDATGAYQQLARHHHTQVEVIDRQADRAAVGRIGFLNAAVVVAILPVRSHPHKAKSVVDAYGQRADLGDFAIRQRDGLRAFFGEGHGGRQLDEAAQVDLRVGHLGLHDFFAEVEDDGVVTTGRHGIAVGRQLAVAIAVFACVQVAVVVQVFGRGRETGLVVDRGRSEYLQGRVDDRSGTRNHRGIDIDVDAVGFHVQQAVVHTHQHGIADMRLGRDKFGRDTVGPRDGQRQRGRHDGQAKVHVVDDQADGAFVDAVEQAVRSTVDPPGEVHTIAVRAAHAGKTGQVGAAQRHGFDLHGEGRAGTQVAQQGGQTTRVHVHREALALAERQRAAQAQKLRHLDFG